MPRPHAVADGTPESVEDDLAVMPRRVRTSLLHQLAEGERIVIRTLQHPAVLARHVPWPLGTLVVYLWLDAGVHAAPPLLKLVGVAFLVGAARLGWAELQRRFRWIVMTNKRILKHEGVLDVSVPMMRLTKVTDMTYRRTLLGEVLGFGTIIIESAGQQQAIRELTFIPEPEEVNAALNSEIFGEKPREKRGQRGRSWPKLPRRSRRRGDGPDDGGPGGGPQRRRRAPAAVGLVARATTAPSARAGSTCRRPATPTCPAAPRRPGTAARTCARRPGSATPARSPSCARATCPSTRTRTGRWRGGGGRSPTSAGGGRSRTLGRPTPSPRRTTATPARSRSTRRASGSNRADPGRGENDVPDAAATPRPSRTPTRSR